MGVGPHQMPKLPLTHYELERQARLARAVCHEVDRRECFDFDGAYLCPCCGERRESTTKEYLTHVYLCGGITAPLFDDEFNPERDLPEPKKTSLAVRFIVVLTRFLDWVGKRIRP